MSYIKFAASMLPPIMLEVSQLEELFKIISIQYKIYAICKNSVQ